MLQLGYRFFACNLCSLLVPGQWLVAVGNLGSLRRIHGLLAFSTAGLERATSLPLCISLLLALNGVDAVVVGRGQRKRRLHLHAAPCSEPHPLQGSGHRRMADAHPSAHLARTQPLAMPPPDRLLPCLAQPRSLRASLLRDQRLHPPGDIGLADPMHHPQVQPEGPSQLPRLGEASLQGLSHEHPLSHRVVCVVAVHHYAGDPDPALFALAEDLTSTVHDHVRDATRRHQFLLLLVGQSHKTLYTSVGAAPIIP